MEYVGIGGVKFVLVSHCTVSGELCTPCFYIFNPFYVNTNKFLAVRKIL